MTTTMDSHRFVMGLLKRLKVYKLGEDELSGVEALTNLGHSLWVLSGNGTFVISTFRPSKHSIYVVIRMISICFHKGSFFVGFNKIISELLSQSEETRK